MSALNEAYADGIYTGYIANLGQGITQWIDPEYEHSHEFFTRIGD